MTEMRREQRACHGSLMLAAMMFCCLHEATQRGNMSDDGETKPMEAESEDRPVLNKRLLLE